MEGGCFLVVSLLYLLLRRALAVAALRMRSREYNVAIGPDNQAVGFWSDARNGRSSRLGTGGANQAGRNPICEQSDTFADIWSAQSGGSADQPRASDDLYLVTPCPAEADDPSTGE